MSIPEKTENVTPCEPGRGEPGGSLGTGQKFLIIDLQPFEVDCRICEQTFAVPRHLPSYGIPLYEDLIVPDDYQGEWGGAPVCKGCYDTVRTMQTSQPGTFVAVHQVRQRLSLQSIASQRATKDGAQGEGV